MRLLWLRGYDDCASACRLDFRDKALQGSKVGEAEGAPVAAIDFFGAGEGGYEGKEMAG